MNKHLLFGNSSYMKVIIYYTLSLKVIVADHEK